MSATTKQAPTATASSSSANPAGRRNIERALAAPGALDDANARKVVKDAKATPPLGTIKTQNLSRAPK
jgi:hypothetical protein